MGLSITGADLTVIETSLEKFKDTLGKKPVKEVARLLVETLTADSRWVNIATKDIGKYTEGRQPEGDFDTLNFQTKTSQGEDITYQVKCDNGSYRVLFSSDKNLIKGWHSDVLARIKAGGIDLTKELANTLFEAGQTIILSRIKNPRQSAPVTNGKKPFQGKPKAKQRA